MQFSKSLSLLLAGSASLVAGIVMNDPHPTVNIAGVNVIDTPIVRLAIEHTRNHSNYATFKHQMRSMLYGSLLIEANETLRATVDIEVQAVAAVLHDLGWDMTPNSTVTSLDHRFEVDGAIAARKFIEQYGDSSWDARRTQLVWDAIALHTTRTIGYYKEAEVGMTSMGIAVDYDLSAPTLNNDTIAGVLAEFPNFDLIEATNETFTFICATKPAQTWGKYPDDHVSAMPAQNNANRDARQPAAAMGRALRARLQRHPKPAHRRHLHAPARCRSKLLNAVLAALKVSRGSTRLAGQAWCC
ncbi:hypothetical protein GGR52DRAFT_558686 [Hypoxylon sp. FL1284]|nr:hypothetical protein GGR52DRAFT_558686 [Hypoxylon sp. FL1284]